MQQIRAESVFFSKTMFGICIVAELSNEKTIDVDLDSTLVNETESNAINAVRNLKLVFQFCDLFQNQRASFPLSTKAQRKKILFLELEDFLYPNQMTKQAIILFIAELFNIMCDQVVTDEPSQIDEGHDQSPPLHDQETFDVSNEDSAEADTMNRERKDSSDGKSNYNCHIFIDTSWQLQNIPVKQTFSKRFKKTLVL